MPKNGIERAIGRLEGKMQSVHDSVEKLHTKQDKQTDEIKCIKTTLNTVKVEHTTKINTLEEKYKDLKTGMQRTVAVITTVLTTIIGIFVSVGANIAQKILGGN